MRDRGGAWRRPEGSGRPTKQEVARVCAGTVGTRPPAHGQEVEEGGGLVGWVSSARPGGLQVSPGELLSLSLLFMFSIFFCNFVAFLKILRYFQKSPNCTFPLFRTYPTWNISV